MTSAAEWEERTYRGVTLRLYPNGHGFALIVRPGEALHLCSMAWTQATKLIDWSLDTHDDLSQLPRPYVKVPLGKPVQAPQPAPAPPQAERKLLTPALPAPANEPKNGKRVYQRDANGRLVF